MGGQWRQTPESVAAIRADLERFAIRGRPQLEFDFSWPAAAECEACGGEMWHNCPSCDGDGCSDCDGEGIIDCASCDDGPDDLPDS